MVCKNKIYFPNKLENIQIYFSKYGINNITKLFGGLTEKLRWIIMYIIYLFIGKVIVYFFREIAMFVINNYKPTLDNYISTEYFLNLVFLNLVYPVIPFFYDILIFKKFLQNYYSQDELQEYQEIFYQSHSMANLFLTYVVFFSYFINNNILLILLPRN
jgi:hypothetical protein